MEFPRLAQFIYSLCGGLLPGGDVRVYRGGEPLLKYFCGCSDEENDVPVNGKELYLGYSVTKLMTVVCALRACEDGFLNLNAPLSEYMSEFAHMRVKDARGNAELPLKTPILVRHLLTMSAGFGADMAFAQGRDTLSAVRALAKQPLLCEPGTHWIYGVCHDVLGAVLECVYGIRLREIFAKLLYAPLGLSNTRFLSEIRDISEIAPLYKAKNGTYERVALDYTYAPSPAYDSGGAGIVTCAEDYSRFLDALASGKLLRPETLRILRADCLSPDMRRDFNWPQCRGYSFGLGLRVPPKPADNETHARAAGGDLLPDGAAVRDCGWGGAAGAYTLIDFETRTSLCFFAHVLGADETLLHRGIRDAFYADMRSK